MKKYKEIVEANDLLKMSTEHVQEWLNLVWSGELTVPKDFNWLGLAEGAHTLSQHGFLFKLDSGIEIEKSLEWGKISILVYEWLIRTKTDYHSIELSVMRLRCLAISKLGPKEGDVILDLNILLEWFWQNLPMPLSEAVQRSRYIRSIFSSGKVKEFSENDLSDLTKLRHFKHKLYNIKTLVESKVLTPDENLKQWIDIYDLLP